MTLLETCPYLYHGRGGRMSVCQMEIHALRDGRVAVICSEQEDNPGSSVTSCAAELAASVCGDRKISPTKLVWIEHNAARGTGEGHIPETWERVTFVVQEDPPGPPQLSEPAWRHMSLQDWLELGLPYPQAVTIGLDRGPS